MYFPCLLPSKKPLSPLKSVANVIPIALRSLQDLFPLHTLVDN